MTAVWGLVMGLGFFLVWRSFWADAEAEQSRTWSWRDRTSDQLVAAGMAGATPGALVGAAGVAGVLTAVVVAAVTQSVVIALCMSVLATRGPFALVSARARARRNRARGLWPDVVDLLASGLRAGLSLPEALAQIGERGPVELREPFILFGEDYRASGRFDDSLNLLKARLADPVGDRIVEALRLTRDVGGTDVGTLLRTLSEFLRDDSRVRGELEARQSWTVNAARLAAAAPWVVLMVLALQPDNAAAYNSSAGAVVLAAGAGATFVAYRLMRRVGRLPLEARVLR